MRVAVLVSSVALFILSASGASAQTPGKDDIINQLTPKQPLTRAIRPTRAIKVEAGEPEKILAEVKTMPSIDIRVLFGIDSDRLTPEGEAALKPLGEALKDPKLASFRILLLGHTDAAGSPYYNDNLSERRAQSVKGYLISTYLIDPSRLQAQGVGFRKLADPARPLDQVNRRVEVVNISQ